MARETRCRYVPNGGGNDDPNNSSGNRGGGGRGGAIHLARIHGTEEDRVNCPFFFKIGACRHADRCSRLHHRPAFSPTILIKHIYRHPVREAELKAAEKLLLNKDKKDGSEGTGKSEDEKVDKKQAEENFLCFFEDMYEELGKFGRIEALNICDNLGDHMIGHVYAKFTDEEMAADALQIMNGRYYDGRKMEVEYSPVTDFREARCRDFDEHTCARGGFCNFMHIKPVPIPLIRSLDEDCEMERRREIDRQRERESRSRKRERRDGSSRRGGSSRSERGSGGSSRRRRDREVSSEHSSDEDNNYSDHEDGSKRRKRRSRSR
mmetsp:Transcript_9154/g.11383  ORF Transcript_9154/g.11383 Transcript_9154/m.11383 type:complete len:321 (+) Transcript_9154:59-1021(+)|eukprot:CAMPEP_0194357242 /NCGR_PEP_ID=MMETSP0174-20130528/4753_1 /TAXON_ID=216777 /ORGANISM="Proboscia alata, Strain PI-D3" /LENGTH=320 /DNA_ID=CAMNT_0039127177 /DNA_START=38 /DNA_END=1000 /DNA_ORIENTATION=+